MRSIASENLVVSPFLVFFLVHATQTGVGVLGFPRNIAKAAGYKSWIGIIIAGLSVHLLVWMLYRILKQGNEDIIGIHRQLFGKWIGGLLSFYFVVYFFVVVVVVLRSYIEVIQVWMFPHLSAWLFGAVLLILAYYYVAGGFRTVTGICFLSVVYAIPLVLTQYYPLQYGHLHNLLTIQNHTVTDYLASAKEMVLSFLGFGMLLMFYPFVKQPQRSQKWAHLGVQFTMVIYLMISIVSFIYYSPEQLMHLPWATLTLWKMVSLAFIERFEYIGLMMWLFVILPILCLGLWCSSLGAKRLFSVKQRTSLMVLVIVAFIVNGLFEDRISVYAFKNIVGEMGFYTFYFYIPLLFFLQMFIHKVRKNRWQKN